jgi:hypothetical protein
MFARTVSIRLKADMKSEFNRTLENQILPLASQPEGLSGRILPGRARWDGSGQNQLVG